jgi:hypothetical protein
LEFFAGDLIVGIEVKVSSETIVIFLAEVDALSL